MRKRIPKKIKPLEPKAITVKLHGSTSPSTYLTDLRSAHPLEHVEPSGPQPMPLLQVSEPAEEENEVVEVVTASPAVRRRALSSLPSFSLLPFVRAGIARTNKQAQHIARTMLSAGAHTRAVASFLIIALLLVSPIPAFSLYEHLHAQGEQFIEQGSGSVVGITDGSALLASGDFFGASKAFSQSLTTLSAMSAQSDQLGSLLKMLPSKGRAAAGQQMPQLVSGTRSLSHALLNVSTGLALLHNDERLLAQTPLERVTAVNDVLRVAQPRLQEAADAFSTLSPHDFPPPYNEHIATLQTSVPLLAHDMKKLIGVNDLLTDVLGEDHFRRYLILFQNDAELRPTGGFMGSLALLDIDRGRIKNLEVPGGGPYDFTFSTNYVKPPQPLLLVNDRWELQDANWFPDFETSARTVMHFWEEAHGPTVDGVIAINASLVESLLQSLPPLELAQYGVSVDANNFRSVTQQQVDLLYDRERNTPKQFVADMAPELLRAIAVQKDPRVVVQLVLALSQGMLNSEVQVYFQDEHLQQVATTLGIDGNIVQTDASTDYLMVVNTNLGGAKTDQVIDQKLHLQTRIEDDGGVINTLTVERTHSGVAGEPFTGSDNINYLRVYVPRGAQLLEASGFALPSEEHFNAPEQWYRTDERVEDVEERGHYDEATGTFVSEEFGKTVFGHWTHTAPGQTSLTRFTYRLPFNVFTPAARQGVFKTALQKLTRAPRNTLGYNLYVQKQSGVKQSLVSATVMLPAAWDVAWHSDNASRLGEDVIAAYLDNNRDTSMALAATTNY